ncbi:hypothetical protein [Microbacterium sp. LWH12-1.2]|uniref:hypothetical protein n=1 Tax=Microbacterium sp. LWH12-1.2 TaxID=3135259 RepID=UPI003415E199
MTRFVQARDVGVIDDGIRVFAAVLPKGPIVVLAGVGAAVWRAALGADLATLAVRLVDGDVCEEGDAVTDAALFTRAFVDSGLLREEEDS